MVDSVEVVSLLEEIFWQIIDQLDWNSVNTENTLLDATNTLSSLSVAEIFLFKDLLAEKLQALDTYDKKEDEVFKYGISSDSIEDDYIDDHETRYGKRLRGNLKKNKDS